MKKIYTLVSFVLFSVITQAQTTITKWDFDNASPTVAMLPSAGTGIFSIIGGAEPGTDTAGLMPSGNPSTGKGYNIKTFPISASGTAGFQFKLSTAGITEAIHVQFDVRGSGTASKWQQYEYTTDGTTWVILSNNAGALTTSFTASPMVSLVLPASCSDKANFGFRIVSIFAPSSSAYATIGSTSTYGPSGTWRIDNVTFSSGSLLGLKKNKITGLNVYPNPVRNGNVFITSNNNISKTIVVYDILGKQVLTAKTANNAVNVSNLKGGTYIVKISEEGKTDIRKLIIE